MLRSTERGITVTNKCGWCGIRIWPWTLNVVKTMFGNRHISCHTERNRSVRRVADLVDQLEES